MPEEKMIGIVSALGEDMTGAEEQNQPAAEPQRLSKAYLDKLYAAVEWSRKKLSKFREQRLDLLKQFVGSHYGDGGASQKVPLNLLRLAAGIYLRTVVGGTPRCSISSEHMKLKPTATDMQTWTNLRLDHIGIAEVLRRWALDAFFCMGVVKVALCDYQGATLQGWIHDPGEPYADVIDFDDWVHDCSATRWDQIAYCGNRYRIPLEAAREATYFDKDARAQLQATERSTVNDGGDERVSSLTTGSDGTPEELDDMVELWDLWLPRENLVITVSVVNETFGPKPLRIVEWDGPEEGPYHLLSFSEVPGNIMPNPPANDLQDLHDLSNILMRKLGRQAERQKTILGVRTGAQGDGKRIIDAADGDGISMDDPNAAREYRTGGVDQNNFAFLIQLKSLFSWQAGNLDSLGGLGAQAETLGQEQMISQTSSKLIQNMQERMVEGAHSVMKHLAWYWWTDPLRSYPVEKRIPGTDIAQTFWLTPKHREGNFLRLNFKIDPYSMRAETPATRLSAIMQMLTQILLPAQPQMAQQGLGISWATLLEKMAKYANMPDLPEIIAAEGPTPWSDKEPTEEAPRQASTSTRNYVRRGAPGMTNKGQDEAMMQMLMSGQNQGGRPPG